MPIDPIARVPHDRDPVIGFCLGGLGGFNAHTVGFLQAAKDLKIAPQVITCTSGGIYWAYRYLAGADLKAEIEAQIKECNKVPHPFEWMNTLIIASTGDPGIFRPATRERIMGWLKPWRTLSPTEILDRMLPAQVYASERSIESFRAMADVFNAATVPVLFNSFELETGTEFLHANAAALAFFNARVGERRGTSIFRPIDAEGLAAAFWLYLYGFKRTLGDRCVIDGAYHRQMIMRELTACDVIYAVKPQNSRWIGPLPQNYFDVQDFTTEMWFNTSLAGEMAQLQLINNLIRDGALRPDSGHTWTELRLVEVSHQLGYFHYFCESEDVYRTAYNQGHHILTQDRARMAKLRAVGETGMASGGETAMAPGGAGVPTAAD